MAVKSLDLIIPDVPPYDRQETWFESFIGHHVRPIAESAPLKRFWFSRYGALRGKKWILFRFESDDIAQVQPHVDRLKQTFALGDTGYSEYDYASDLGEGEGSRFLGNNRRHQDKQRRGDLVFAFLHTSAQLFLDCLAGPDANGYFEREPETTSGFSRETSLEQFHHLFCNMTGVPSFVVEAVHPVHGNQIMSEMTFVIRQMSDQRWQGRRLERVKF